MGLLRYLWDSSGVSVILNIMNIIHYKNSKVYHSPMLLRLVTDKTYIYGHLFNYKLQYKVLWAQGTSTTSCSTKYCGPVEHLQTSYSKEYYIIQKILI